MVTSTRLTLEEFLAMPDIDERRLELIDGEVYEKVSPRWGHGRIAGVLWSLLDELGFAAVEPRAVIPGDASHAGSSPLPDVAFYREEPPPDNDWMRTPPDLAVEILSPGQSRTEMRAKVDIYLGFGVPVVWVFDPERETVDVYDGGARRTLSHDDTLTASTVPGFACRIREIFERKRRA